MTIGTTITSKHMKILMKKYSKHKELQNLTQKLYEFQNTPLSLSFMARKALRTKLQSEGCYDLENNFVVLELPKPLKVKMFLKPVREGKMHGVTKIGVFCPLLCV